MAVKVSVPVEMAHLLVWHAEVSLHIKDCRANWLSLVDEGEKEYGLR